MADTAPFTVAHRDDLERTGDWALGAPTLVIDGTDHPAPAGTFARLDPAPRRTVRNDGDDVATVLIVSAPRTSGYEPMAWA